MKQRAAKHYKCEPKDLPALPVMGAAGLGGILYWLAIFPVDVIKSAIMTDSIDPKHRKYPNIVGAARVSFSRFIVYTIYSIRYVDVLTLSVPLVCIFIRD